MTLLTALANEVTNSESNILEVHNLMYSNIIWKKRLQFIFIILKYRKKIIIPYSSFEIFTTNRGIFL